MKSRSRATVKILVATSMLVVCPAFIRPQTRNTQTSFPTARWSPKVISSQSFQMGGATLQVDFASGDLDLDSGHILTWVQNAAHAVTVFYGRFPVKRARILIVPVSGERDSIHGTTWGDVDGFPAVTRMRIGQHVTERDLSEDWTMTHELVHMAFASLPDNQNWMEEGLATYVEPIARAQAGQLSARQVWKGMVLGMPLGEPDQDDRGLDRTHTWGRTYWGGAMFCLVADVSIRRQTQNRKGLQDALRAIVAAGDTINKERLLIELLEIGDRATKTNVLTGMYRKWSGSPSQIDLQNLWIELGIRANYGDIDLIPDASLSKIRDSITSRSLPVS